MLRAMFECIIWLESPQAIAVDDFEAADALNGSIAERTRARQQALARAEACAARVQTQNAEQAVLQRELEAADEAAHASVPEQQVGEAATEAQ